MPRKIADLSGRVFGRLTVEARGADYVSPKGKRIPQWRCRCECGGGAEVPTSILLRGATVSCGCYMRERISARSRTHGRSRTRLYGLYRSMLQRCCDPGCPAYADYGGRGIKVCDRWLGKDGFANFATDMGEKPPGLTLERNDVNGDYSPENCCWATRKAQARNTRKTIYIAINGKTRPLAEWAEISGLTQATLRRRVELGWPEDRLLTCPLPRGCFKKRRDHEWKPFLAAEIKSA